MTRAEIARMMIGYARQIRAWSSAIGEMAPEIKHIVRSAMLRKATRIEANALLVAGENDEQRSA